MPIIKGSASEFTTLARVNATQTTDPEKKSRTFVAPNKMVIAPIVRASSTSMMPLTKVVRFNFTGGSQRFDVPTQVDYLIVTLLGAGGGSHAGGSYLNGGAGGYVSGYLGVTPGETLDIVVGGGGGPGVGGGYGGGGTGWDTKTSNTPGGGGGRTAIRRQGADIVTAGGGGGAGRGPSGVNGYGGAGGGPVGATAGNGTVSNGRGGTQTAGGAAGSSSTETGVAGSQYQGGNGAIGIITGLTLNNSSGTMTITGTIPNITFGNRYGFYVTISDSSNSSLNGSWQVSGTEFTPGWTTNSVTVITNISDSITNITGATMRGNNDDTGGGGGGWFGGGGGGLDVNGNYGGGGGGGSSYTALLDPSRQIMDIQGGGAAGGTGVANDPQRGGGNGSCIIQYSVIPGYHNWKSPPFNGRIYIT